MHRDWRMLVRSQKLVLLVDLDGTLVEFAATPEEAVLDDEAIATLAGLVASDVQVMIVSGRPRSCIEPLRAAVPGAWWVAEHGSWRWDPELSARPASNAPELDQLEAALQHLLAHPGARVERKSLSLCAHWRLVPENERAALVSGLESACDKWLEGQPTFERLPGVEMLEVRQRSVHKGTVVSWVRDRVRGARIIAIGDDVTDEDMFAALDDSDASVSVGPRMLQADAHARDVSSARAFLRWVAATRSGETLELPIVPVPQRKRQRQAAVSNRTPGLAQDRMRDVTEG